MNRISLAKSDVEFDPADPEGFKAGMLRPGPELGAKNSGATFYELPPGEALCPYHYEWAEEEWLLVLEGTPTIRDPDGEHRLAPLDLVFFTTGPEGAHRVQNDSDETVRMVMFSDLRWPAATVYPDSDKVGIWTDRDRTDSLLTRRSSGVEYYDGEV